MLKIYWKNYHVCIKATTCVLMPVRSWQDKIRKRKESKEILVKTNE